MELLSGLGVGFLAKLHGVAPSTFCHHQRDEQKFVVVDHRRCNIPTFEVTFVPLRKFQHSAKTSQTSWAVSSVSLIVSVTKTMLLLSIFYYVVYYFIFIRIYNFKFYSTLYDKITFQNLIILTLNICELFLYKFRFICSCHILEQY